MKLLSEGGIVSRRRNFDVCYEWSYTEVLKRCFDGSYSLQESGESVFVGTVETGFNLGKMTADKKNAQVGKILSFNSAYKLILFKVSSNAATMSRPKNACDLLMRSAKIYDQLPTLKNGNSGPLRLHNWIIEEYLMSIPTARFAKNEKNT